VLESIFGRDYVEYKRRTPRWVPRPPEFAANGTHAWSEALRSEISTFAAYGTLAFAFWVKARSSS
jgi:hypothetical protein